MSERTKLLLSGIVAAVLLPSASVLAAPVELTATLDGASETHEADADGTGSFTGEFDAQTGDLCYMLSSDQIGDPVAAHIHAGAAGTDGKPVVTLEMTGEGEDLCIAVEPDTLKPIIAAPAEYYVNVHTKEFPAGAIRGQLGAGE